MSSIAMLTPKNISENVSRDAFEDAQFNSRREQKTLLLDIVQNDESNFDTFFASIIILNLIVIGIETDHGEENQTMFRVVETIFLVCYVVEFALRLRLFRKFCELDEKRAREQHSGPQLLPNGAQDGTELVSVEKKIEAGTGQTKDTQGEDCEPEDLPLKKASTKRMNSRLADKVATLKERIQEGLSDTVSQTEKAVLKAVFTSKAFRVAWLGFDGILIIGSLVGLFSSLGSDDNTEEGTRLIVLRIVRILRIVRSFKLVRYFKDLYLLLHALYRGTGTIFWVAFLLAVVVFICAVFLCRSVGKNDEFQREAPEVADRFGSMGDAMFTLFQVMTLEGWVEICMASMKVEPAMAAFFVGFIIFTHFTVLNLFVAVLVEHVMQFATTADLELMRKMQDDQRGCCERLRKVFIEADANGDQSMDVKEFKTMLALPEVKVMLKDMGVETDISWLFDILDIDKSGSLHVGEFLEGILTTRSSELSKQLMRVQYTLIGEIRRIHRKQKDILRGGDALKLSGVGSGDEDRKSSMYSLYGPPKHLGSLGAPGNVTQKLEAEMQKLGNRLSNVEQELQRSMIESKKNHAEVLAAIQALSTPRPPVPQIGFPNGTTLPSMPGSVIG